MRLLPMRAVLSAIVVFALTGCAVDEPTNPESGDAELSRTGETESAMASCSAVTSSANGYLSPICGATNTVIFTTQAGYTNNCLGRAMITAKTYYPVCSWWEIEASVTAAPQELVGLNAATCGMAYLDYTLTGYQPDGAKTVLGNGQAYGVYANGTCTLRASKKIHASNVATTASGHLELTGASAKYVYDPILGHFVKKIVNVTLEIDSQH